MNNNQTIGGYLSDQKTIRSQYINYNFSDTNIKYFTENGRYELTKTLYSVLVDHINVTDIVNSLTIFDYNSMSKLNNQHESMDMQNNDLTNNIYQSNNAIALKLKKLEKNKIQFTQETQFGEQDNTLKYSILSLSITIIMFLLRCIFKNKKLGKIFNKLYQVYQVFRFKSLLNRYIKYFRTFYY
jgi:hypothetical protein